MVTKYNITVAVGAIAATVLSMQTCAGQVLPDISLLPSSTVLQGEPLLMTTQDEVHRATLNGKNIPLFSYEKKRGGLIGIDLNQEPGDYPLMLDLANGNIATTTIHVLKRHRAEAPLGIPEKLGGNTTSSQKKLISSLSRENSLLASLKTGTKAFWSKPFQLPLAAIAITDPYGYNRKTGSYTIVHKGTDFRAAEGTPVMAMNRGVVRLARTLPTYGKTVVVDHGLGVETLYMHLSKINVREGTVVAPGETIASSGKTGYAQFPHLHVSVKIQGVSIDPAKFLNLFGYNL